MLSDQDILGVYEIAKEQGHPDPIGLIARSEVITDLDDSFATKERFGIAGVRQEDVERIGVGEASDAVDNLAAAIRIDMDNFSNFKDVANMHVAFHSGGEAVADRSKRPKKFMRKLAKKKLALDKRIKSLQKNKPQKKTEKVETSLGLGLSVPEFGRVEAKQLSSNAGDASKLETIRNNSRSVTPKKREIPKTQVAASRKKLRSIIREAIQRA